MGLCVLDICFSFDQSWKKYILLFSFDNSEKIMFHYFPLSLHRINSFIKLQNFSHTTMKSPCNKYLRNIIYVLLESGTIEDLQIALLKYILRILNNCSFLFWSTQNMFLPLIHTKYTNNLYVEWQRLWAWQQIMKPKTATVNYPNPRYNLSTGILEVAKYASNSKTKSIITFNDLTYKYFSIFLERIYI